MRTRQLSRVLIGIALVGLLLSAAGLVYLRLQPPQAPALPTATPVPMDIVFVANQDIPPGTNIQPEMVVAQPWPRGQVPAGAIYDPTRIYGQLSRVYIAQGQVFVPSLLSPPGRVAGTGSLAAAMLKPGEVAVAYPITALSSVAYGLKAGDYVDLVVTLQFVDIDVDFQSKLPNQMSVLAQDVETGAYYFVPVGLLGRVEEDGTLLVPVYVMPAEDQRPRLVAQMTIRDARVLHVGLWEEALPTVTPEVQPTPVGASPATPTPGPEDVITIAVSPQDAVVVNFLLSMGAHTSFALRAKDDHQVTATDPVTLDYIMENFGIPLPVKLPYGFVGPTPSAPTPTPIPATPED